MNRDLMARRAGLPVTVAHPAARMVAPVAPGIRYVTEAWRKPGGYDLPILRAELEGSGTVERLTDVRYSPTHQCFEIIR